MIHAVTYQGETTVTGGSYTGRLDGTYQCVGMTVGDLVDALSLFDRALPVTHYCDELTTRVQFTPFCKHETVGCELADHHTPHVSLS